MGYRYAINRTVEGDRTSVCRYENGAWKKIPEGNIRVSGNTVQVRVKLSDLGLNASDFSIRFKVTDNIKNEEDPLSFFTTGDAAPIGRLSYTYGY